MDIHNLFKEISEQLLAEFRKIAGVKHSGGKGDLREDAFRAFLSDYLPKRYAVGRGEVITPENQVSGELDIVIYDPTHCPVFIRSSSHSVYPLESVYGAINMKSHLDSGELAEAYQNVASLKNVLIRRSFQLNPGPGMSVGMHFPMPVTGVVAYSANRSLDAIAAQAKQLDAALADKALRPDFIAVIGLGIVGPSGALRRDFNVYDLPKDPDDLVTMRKTGRHTLLRLYMQILRELNILRLKPLELTDYQNMPRLVGPYRVRRHNRFVRSPSGAGASNAHVSRLNEKAITEIVSNAKPVDLKQHFQNTVGQIPFGAEKVMNMIETIYEYNPKNLPLIGIGSILRDAEGRPYLGKPGFQPVPVEIDGKNYAVDFGALLEEHFEEDNDFTVDELFAS